MKAPEEIESELLREVKKNNVKDAIVTIRVSGRLGSGRVSDIDFKNIFNEIYELGAYFVMKNTAAVATQDFEEIKVHEDTVDAVESSLIDEHTGQITLENVSPEKEKEVTEQLVQVLNQHKKDGERNIDFEQRIITNLDEVLRTLGGF